MDLLQKNRNLIRILLLTGGIVLLVTGLMTGGFDDVRRKAVMICMECIGIG